MPGKKKLPVKNIFDIGDAIALAAIIAGLFLVVLSESAATKVIGISVIILSLIRTIISFANRIRLFSEAEILKPSLGAKDYKTKETIDKNAKRITVENFSEDKLNEEPGPKEFINGDEGFKIVDEETEDEKKEAKKRENIDEKDADKKERQTVEDDRTEKEEKLEEFEFSDDISSVKIISSTTKNSSRKDSDFSDEKNEKIVKSETVSKIDLRDYSFQELLKGEVVFPDQPRKEFENFLVRILKIIKKITDSKSAIFLLVNAASEELIVEAFASENPGDIANRKKIPFGKDAPSQIAINAKPEILAEINPVAVNELLPYYKVPSKVQSFIGIPVFYKQSVVGVLCADSETANAYGVGLVEIFEHFSKLLAAVVHNYAEKFDLSRASKTLEVLANFKAISSKSKPDPSNIAATLSRAAAEIFERSAVGVALRDFSSSKWIVSEYKGILDDDYSIKGDFVEEGSMLAKALSEEKPLALKNLSEVRIRVSKSEKNLKNGYFYAFPLKSASGVYGALFLEGYDPEDVTEPDLQIALALSDYAGAAIEQAYFSNLLINSLLIDPSTGLLNTPAFLRRLEEEIARSVDFGYPSSLCLLEIDKYKTLDPAKHKERSEIAFMETLKKIREKLRVYDLIGRAESNVFGILLVDMDAGKAKIWAEKLRKDIATNIVKIGDETFSITVSVGLVQVNVKASLDKALEDAKKALEISKKKTNAVTAYE